MLFTQIVTRARNDSALTETALLFGWQTPHKGLLVYVHLQNPSLTLHHGSSRSVPEPDLWRHRRAVGKGLFFPSHFHARSDTGVEVSGHQRKPGGESRIHANHGACGWARNSGLCHERGSGGG